MLKMIPLKAEHASIAPYLRKQDRDEIEAFSGLNANEAVSISIATSLRGFCAYWNDTPCAVFGVSPEGYIWLLGTDEITKHPVTFYRVSRKIFPVLAHGVNRLENYVDARNTLSLRWLRWMGFDISAPIDLGAECFHHVVWNRGD